MADKNIYLKKKKEKNLANPSRDINNVLFYYSDTSKWKKNVKDYSNGCLTFNVNMLCHYLKSYFKNSILS